MQVARISHWRLVGDRCGWHGPGHGAGDGLIAESVVIHGDHLKGLAGIGCRQDVGRAGGTSDVGVCAAACRTLPLIGEAGCAILFGYCGGQGRADQQVAADDDTAFLIHIGHRNRDRTWCAGHIRRAVIGGGNGDRVGSLGFIVRQSIESQCAACGVKRKVARIRAGECPGNGVALIVIRGEGHHWRGCRRVLGDTLRCSSSDAWRGVGAAINGDGVGFLGAVLGGNHDGDSICADIQRNRAGGGGTGNRRARHGYAGRWCPPWSV